MSEDIALNHWKRESGVSNSSLDSLFIKTDFVEEPTSSSSHMLFVQPNMQSEQVSTQHSLELQKNSIITKVNNIDKGVILEGITNVSEKDRLKKVQQIVEAGIGDHAKQQILHILDKISLLKPPERLLLYLRMPGGLPETDPLRQPQNPLGTRSEINHTINWVRSHLEHDPKVSIPKQDVYNDYVAYCERVDIKPLSTADFGKVMKQVFPEIRPRRLGTRGHSRYCYAAMRKATKLSCPLLPDLGVCDKTVDNGTIDEDSWKIIRMWVEGLLNSSFNSLSDLAAHITKHNLNSPTSNSSRILLQKRLLQKDNKDKRKFNDTGSLKKRRKKKRKNSSSSESVQNTVSISDASLDGQRKSIKSEVLEPVPILGQSQTLQTQQILPMNLTAVQDNVREIHGTNLTCDNNLVVAKSISAENPNSFTRVTTLENRCAILPATEKLVKLEHNDIKEEISEEYPPNIFCKKVRRAQQNKGLWNQLSNLNPSTTTLMAPPGEENVAQRFSRTTNSLMGPPGSLILEASSNDSLKRTTINHPHCNDNSQNCLPRNSSPLLLRAKKLRCINKTEAINESQTTHSVVDASTEKDVLPENLGIPRERVISICNMDKRELDDYLNEEENSQDQEAAELLQYFQPEESGAKSEDIVSTAETTAFPILENYQLYGNAKEERKMMLNNDGDEIIQLRHYLHQNLQNSNGVNSSHSNKNIEKHTFEKISAGDVDYSGVYASGPASTSLALMSQRHLPLFQEDQANVRCYPNNFFPSNENSTAVRGSRRKINLSARACVPSSPNTRRKNFSFVPISSNNSSSHMHYKSVEFSPFVSPRSTPVVRKPPLHKQNSLPSCEPNATDSIVNTQGSTCLEFQNVSASAPPSPSLVQQRFRFTPSNTLASAVNVPLSNINEHFNTLQPIAVQCRGQNSASDGVPESRSQSVPLHCRNSPGFNHSNNFTGFSSTCSSVRQTPVPPDFNDFNDPTILDIFSETAQNHPVKSESNAPSLLVDAEMPSNEPDIAIGDMLSTEFSTKGNVSANNSSRSVPSTPLPVITYRSSNNRGSSQDISNTSKAYDISKSVPTTPVAMIVAPFRYSPEMNRDYLINGNSVDSGKINSFYNNQAVAQQPQQTSQCQNNDTVSGKTLSTSLPETIDELSNFGVVAESIIGSDILNNI